LGVGQQRIVVDLVQPQVGDRLGIPFRLGLRQAIDDGRRHDVLHPFDVHVVQVLAGPHVAIGRMVLLLLHLLVKLGGDNHPHGRLSVDNIRVCREL
jgi:hypothetical protein